ncbi:ABC transporter permease subunit [Tundrisphaera lichenicola]|uniref:ABC transporter permease subunit n=1 Tax=Tundrisphaera lichenicola TaxID=2029860 RepID=UPI003EBAFED2
MFAGPIIAREVLTAPRPLRFYVARAAYVGLLFILMWTAWQSQVGLAEVSEIGIIAYFGHMLFRLFVLFQLTLMLFFAPLSAATAVAHEKDRRTFVLLLMTDLSDIEIILGKLAASLLQILTLLATAAPVFFLCLLLGGISPGQILDVVGVTAAAGLLGGSLGLLVALGRDRTFQSLALTVLTIVLALAGIEAFSAALPNLKILGVPVADALDPYRTVLTVIDPVPASSKALSPGVVFMLAASSLSVLLLAFSTKMLRVWNPGRNEPREQREGADVDVAEELIQIGEKSAPLAVSFDAQTLSMARSGGTATIEATRASSEVSIEDANSSTGLHVPRRAHQRITRGPGRYRKPWTNPVLWRELMTRAYGTKPLIIKAAYILAFALGVLFVHTAPDPGSMASRQSWTLILLGILSLILINAQGVTALTSERDTGALDLLLVTELSPKQFIYGKLYGVLYNTKEMVLLPVFLTIWFAIYGLMSVENATYAIIDGLLLAHFSAMLGLHSAITYTNSRTAVASSLGTIFFLMIGIGICAWLILLSDRQFARQLLSFMIFIGAGSVALFGSLGAKNPSRAIALVALLTPFWSFYCVISLLNRDVLAAFLFSIGIYGFALLAMLVPAVSDFDIALGRTSAIQG